MLTWDRVTDWEIEEHEDDVVLTLQGSGAATPLLIPGWSAADLDALLRQSSEQPSPTPAPDQVKQAGGAKGDAGAGSRGASGPGVVELLGTSARGRDRRAHGRGPVLAPAGATAPAGQGRGDHRAAGCVGHGGDHRAPAERRHHQLEFPRPHQLTGIRTRLRPSAPRRRGRPRSRRPSRPGSGPVGTRPPGGCRAGLRAASRTRTATSGPPGWHAP